MQITCIVGGYNEAERLPGLFAHANRWADEVLYFDKSSTDGSIEIARKYGARAFTEPYTRAGFENPANWVPLARNDWCFFVTPGEVPTMGLIRRVREALALHGETADLICIPKKLYSFGIHDTDSPWSISYQPFLINRTKAVISPAVHHNFMHRPGGEAITIPFSDTCHMLHPTHATAEGFLLSHCDYALAEGRGMTDPSEKLREAVQMLKLFTVSGRKPELTGQAFAWMHYWSGVALVAIEQARGVDVPLQYLQMTENALAEWRAFDIGATV